MANKKTDPVFLLSFAASLLVLQSFLLVLDKQLVDVRINLALQLVVFILFIWWSIFTTGSVMNAPLVFVASLYFWHSAWFFCHFFKLAWVFVLYTGKVFDYGVDQLPWAIALIGWCQAATVAGLFMAYTQVKKVSRQSPLSAFKSSVSSRRLVCLLVAVYVGLTFIYTIKIGSGFYHERYSAAFYLIQPQGNWLYRIYHSTKFFSILMLITAMAYVKKSYLVWLWVLLAAMVVIQFTLGSRIMPFMTIITFFVAFDHFIKRQYGYRLIIFVLILAIISCGVSHARTISMGWNVFNIFAYGYHVNIWGFIWDAQQGSIVARTMQFIHERGSVFYGMSLADAVIYVVPRFIVDGLGFKTGFIPPNRWLLLRSYDVPHGGNLGFSLVAESYFNFGMLGFLMFLGIGWLLGRYYFKYVFFKDKYALLHALNFSLVLALNMHNYIGSYFRYLVYGFLFIELLRRLDKRACA